MSYNHQLYAQSFEEFGDPIYLPNCDGWLLKRPIRGTDYYDAMGLYPLFTCDRWSKLDSDIAELSKKGIVSLVLVIDPFTELSVADLNAIFPAKSVPYKDHYVSDIALKLTNFISGHHRYYSRKAVNKNGVIVARVEEPANVIGQWLRLYKVLIKKHSITGLRTFSERAFKFQLSVPSAVVFKAEIDKEIVGMHIWYIKDEVAYHHLAAYSDLGYRSDASYALFYYALDYLRANLQVSWAELGGGTGSDPGQKPTLDQFKKGWSTATKTAYLCGRVYNEAVYRELAESRNTSGVEYFPEYRYGEFS